MTTPTALETLIELATIETDKATRRFGQAVRAGEIEQQKLALLRQYREDYAARFQATRTAGLTAVGYHNFQVFMDQLDEAIKGQEQVVAHAGLRTGQERSGWQDCERKRISYDMLAARAEHTEQQRAARREQKQTHEQAARLLFNKR
jgi:flagellar FliJ protein